MWFRNIFILFFSVIISDIAYAQGLSIKDSSHFSEKIDSTHINKNIESFSGRSKFSKFMFHLIFKPSATGITKNEPKNIPNRNVIQKKYSSFEGKAIRHINIETLDPFCYLNDNMVIIPHNFLSNTGNKLHIKSQRLTIRNLLLFQQNQRFDSLLVKESERLIRSQRYVHDVSFFVVPAGSEADSVDIYIRELDIWSIEPVVSISNLDTKAYITDKNFIGLGHEFENDYEKDLSNGKTIFNTNYFIPNIRNTYINTTLHFGIDQYKNYNNSLAIDRPFYSPFAKWAAGVSFASQYKQDSLKNSRSVSVPLNLRFSTQDYWAGIAHQVFKSNTEWGHATNLIVAARYLRIRYFDLPSELYDPIHKFSGEDFYLAGIGFSTRRYIQDRYIFNYDVIEDVPVGKVYGITGGYQV